MRACGNCNRPVKKYGPPKKLGYFLDQIVVCPKCGWVGVETEILEDQPKAWQQPALFDFPPQTQP